MADQNQPVIIIRKKKRGGHGGHHGGAWKVAYADFVTAMMAFFLLMWLLNMTSPAQRQAIAEYFAPTGISPSNSGAGGVMGGMSVSSQTGAALTDGAPLDAVDTERATFGEGEEGEEETQGKNEKGAGKEDEKLSPEERIARDAASLATAMKKEEEKFKETEKQIMQAISQTPGLEGLAQHLIIDRTAEGLRIQIVDKDRFSLFPSGSSMPFEKGRDLLRLVGKVIARLSNQISITGHTDSAQFVRSSRRDNWNLSADRANVSRMELLTGGVPEPRIARVVGLADRDPLIPDNPADSRNRRISIVLLRHGLSAKETKETSPLAAEPIKANAVQKP